MRIETQLLQENFENAAKLYYEAAELKTKFSTASIWNGFRVSEIVGDRILFCIYANELINRGADSLLIVNSEFGSEISFDEVRHTQIGFDKYFLKNLELRYTIEEMHHLDQQFRIEGIQDSIDYADSINFKKLEEIILNYGYPTEEHVGAWFNSKGLTHNYIDIVILHYLQQGNKSINNALYKEMIDGDLCPFKYLNWLQYSFTPDFYVQLTCSGRQSDFVIYNDQCYQYTCENDSIFQEVERNRITYNLDHSELTIKKQLLRYKYNIRLYETSNAWSIGSFGDKKSESKFLTNIRPIVIE